MKLIPKFYGGNSLSLSPFNTNPTWYEELWDPQKVPGLVKPNSGIYNNNLNYRYSGINLDRVRERNLAYIDRNNRKNRENDIAKAFSNIKANNLEQAFAEYNKKIDLLDNTFTSGQFNYDPTKFDATLHNDTYKDVYFSSTDDSNRGKDFIGWDESKKHIGGSSTWQRRATKYQTTFDYDLENDIEAARDRLYKTPYGYGYIDETGRINPLSNDHKQKLGLTDGLPLPTPELQIDPEKIKTDLNKLQANVNDQIKNGSFQGSGDIKNRKTNWLSNLKNAKLDPQLLNIGRVFAVNQANLRHVNELNSQLDPALQLPDQEYRQIHGDYIAKQNAEKQAARLLSDASRPFTADADRQMAYQLEAIDKGNQSILAGQQRDAQEFYRTSEAAFEQAKENTKTRTNIANINRRLLADNRAQKAMNLYSVKLQNTANWDDLAKTYIDRKLKEKDERYKLAFAQEQDDLLKRRQKEEDFASLQDLRGIDESRVRQALEQLEAASNNPTAYQAALSNLQHVSKLNNYLRLYNEGVRKGYNIDPLKKYLSKYVKFNNDGTFNYLKNGGILRKLQQGGGFLPAVSTASLMGRPYQLYLDGWERFLGQAGVPSRSSSKSSSKSDSDKEETSLLKGIVETLKGADILQSDMEVISRQLKKFFDIQQYAPESMDTDYLYRGYIDALSNLNRAKQSSNNFKQAYDNVLKNGGLHEAAITPEGAVYVGVRGSEEIATVTPDQYLENPDKFKLLTNEDVLFLRQNKPQLAFDDKAITQTVANGVGMDQVSKFIKEFVGTLGHNKDARDQLVYNFGPQAEQGLKVLQDLQAQGFTKEQTAAVISGDLKGLWELNNMTQSQIEQAKLAIQAVFKSLPNNMKSLLILKAGGSKQAGELVTNMILSRTTTETAFSVDDFTPVDENGNIKSSTKTGTGGSEGSDEAQDRVLSNIQRGIGGTRGRLTINPGTKSQFSVDVINYQLEGSYHAGNLEDALAESKVMGIVSDKTKIYFGDQKIPTERLSDIAYLGRGFSRAILPVKQDGSPDFTIFERYEAACEATRKRGYDPVSISNGKEDSEEAKKVFGEELAKVQLFGLVDRNGIPNLSRMGVFLVTEGLGSTKAGIQDSQFVNLSKDPDYDLMRQLLSKKGIDGKVQEYDIDDKERWNPADGFGLIPSMYDSIYEGTIYIPISTNELQGTTAAGNKIKSNTVQRLEQDYQAQSKLHQYNPVTGSTENILLQ